MKLNIQNKRHAGMTLLELTVVILVLLSLISILFVGARAWKKGSDRSANLMNIRNCQQAMRGEQNMKQLDPADPFTQDDLEEYIKFPQDIGTNVTYTAGTEITPESANPAIDMAHIWLVPSDPGKVGGEYGPGDPDDTLTGYQEITGW